MEESQKRKRQLAAAADDEGERKDRGRVTEDEVERFFAIVRRLQDAKSSLWSEHHDIRDGGGDDRGEKKIARREVAAPRWRPRFVLEDFEGVADGDDGVGSPSAVDGKVSYGGGADLEIDLNVEPGRNRL
ncbi:NRR repressor homolog 1-like [Musa acuminata AAA Group]|uniref:NRR repressor homolog 1-like n=1 Tax=Musa acuminata AAA Group TaxID=214697 RepID=UPI0031DE94A4